MEHLFHIARRSAWEAALTDGAYTISTLEKTLEEEGFIHASFADQVAGTAERFYRGVPDLVLLEIDPAKLRVEVKVEGGFPHIYGPLNVDAVQRAAEYVAPVG